MAPRRNRLTDIEKLQAEFEVLHGYAAPDGNRDDDDWLKSSIAKRLVFKRYDAFRANSVWVVGGCGCVDDGIRRMTTFLFAHAMQDGAADATHLQVPPLRPKLRHSQDEQDVGNVPRDDASMRRLG